MGLFHLPKLDLEQLLESWAVTGRHCIALSSPQGTAASTLSWNMQTAGCWHSLEKEGLEDSEAAQLVVFRLQSCHCIASLYCISITNSPTCRRDGTCNLYAVPVTMQDRAALIKSTPPPPHLLFPFAFPSATHRHGSGPWLAHQQDFIPFVPPTAWPRRVCKVRCFGQKAIRGAHAEQACGRP